MVQSWFELLPANQQETARLMHAEVMVGAPQLDACVRSGHLVYALDSGFVMALQPHRQHLHLQVFHAAGMVAQFPQLEGTAKGPRQLRIRYGQAVDEDLVHRLVHAVVAGATGVRANNGAHEEK
jgi:hypothetical protein